MLRCPASFEDAGTDEAGSSSLRLFGPARCPAGISPPMSALVREPDLNLLEAISVAENPAVPKLSRLVSAAVEREFGGVRLYVKRRLPRGSRLCRKRYRRGLFGSSYSDYRYT